MQGAAERPRGLDEGWGMGVDDDQAVFVPVCRGQGKPRDDEDGSISLGVV